MGHSRNSAPTVVGKGLGVSVDIGDLTDLSGSIIIGKIRAADQRPCDG